MNFPYHSLFHSVFPALNLPYHAVFPNTAILKKTASDRFPFGNDPALLLFLFKPCVLLRTLTLMRYLYS